MILRNSFSAGISDTVFLEIPMAAVEMANFAKVVYSKGYKSGEVR
jgi:hypothetical protein